VFLLLGYGTKVGLAPLHAWLPDAHAEGPTPISRVSGLLLNVALYALLRFKMLLAVNPAAIAPGPLMVTMGLISVIFRGSDAVSTPDIKRMFAYSSIEHMGIIVFAFGMGGALANFAGCCTLTMHSLTKSAIFFAVVTLRRSRARRRSPTWVDSPSPIPCSAGDWCSASSRLPIAAARHLHERVPGGEVRRLRASRG